MVRRLLMANECMAVLVPLVLWYSYTERIQDECHTLRREGEDATKKPEENHCLFITSYTTILPAAAVAILYFPGPPSTR